MDGRFFYDPYFWGKRFNKYAFVSIFGDSFSKMEKSDEQVTPAIQWSALADLN